MTVQASWLGQKFEISNQKIRALEGISISKSLAKKENESKSGKNPTNTRGMESQNLSIEYYTTMEAGGQPREEYESWQQLMTKRGPFILGNERFGPQELILEGVDLTDTVIDTQGRIRKAKIVLHFIQELEKPQKAKDKSNKTPGIGSGKEKSAAKIGPSERVKTYKAKQGG